MNAAILEVTGHSTATLPAAHTDAALMADLAGEIARVTGFENLGVPFCMTVEAEALGSEISLGTQACEPKIERERYASVEAVEPLPLEQLLASPRVAVVAEAVQQLAARHPELPVIGSLTGPLSTAASLVDPPAFFKGLRKHPEASHRVLAYVTDFLAAYAGLLVQSGATAIAIGDPSATGEILGPRLFEEYAVPYLNRLASSIRALGAPVILHICGDMNVARGSIPLLVNDALSTDAVVNLRRLKAEVSGLTTMGNVSTFLLQSGTPEAIARRARRLVAEGVDIISPACGLSTSSPAANVQALTQAVKS